MRRPVSHEPAAGGQRRTLGAGRLAASGARRVPTASRSPIIAAGSCRPTVRRRPGVSPEPERVRTKPDTVAVASDLTTAQLQLQAAFSARAKYPATTLFNFLA